MVWYGMVWYGNGRSLCVPVDCRANCDGDCVPNMTQCVLQPNVHSRLGGAGSLQLGIYFKYLPFLWASLKTPKIENPKGVHFFIS